MHLYVMTKGELRSLKQWENDLQAVRLPMKIDGKPALIRLGVRPMQLYELGFPEEHLDHILAMSGASNYITDRYPKIKRYVKWFSKLLGLKKVPKIDKELVKKYYHMQPDQIFKAVGVIPLGTKEDINDFNGEQI